MIISGNLFFDMLYSIMCLVVILFGFVDRIIRNSSDEDYGGNYSPGLDEMYLGYYLFGNVDHNKLRKIVMPCIGFMLFLFIAVLAIILTNLAHWGWFGLYLMLIPFACYALGMVAGLVFDMVITHPVVSFIEWMADVFVPGIRKLFRRR